MKRTLALLLMLALLLGLTPIPAHADDAAVRYVLPVFETSDVHGHLVDTSGGSEAYYQYRLAFIADKVDDLRGGDPSRTLLCDGGDIYQGNVVSNLQDGWPMVAAFDAMEYDAVALGNHEFDWGIETTTDPDGTMPRYTLNSRDYDSQIPILCCNLYEKSTSSRVSFTQDYRVFEKTAVAADGQTRTVRVAVVGYVGNYAGSIMSSRFADYYIRSGVGQAESIARTLLSSGQADCAVLLTHTDAEDVAKSLSSATPFCLILGGHTHQSECGTVGGVTYLEPWAKATSYARAELCFYGDEVRVENAKIVSITDNTALLRDNTSNRDELAADVLAVSHAALDGVQEALKTPLGYITTSVTGEAIGDNPMSTTGGNWMTDLANRATGAKVSFTNAGGIRTSFYVYNGRRNITKGDIYTIAPFNNRLYVYELSYAELLQVLNYAIGYGQGLSLRMSGIDCYYTNNTVRALVEDGKCIYKNGKWMEGKAEQKILVSANEFIATSSGTPFYKWNGTSHFVDNELIDNESFLTVLAEEGKGSGLLYVDPAAHFLKSDYSGALDKPDKPQPIENPFEDVAEDAYYFQPVLWAVESGVTGGIDGTHFGPNQPCTRAQVVTFLYAAAGKPAPTVGMPNPFADVPIGAYYYNAVLWAYGKGITGGVDKTHFGPGKTCTRAQVVTFLYSWKGKPAYSATENPFDDVAKTAYYYDAVMWAVENGVTGGTGPRTFGPNKSCTRCQVVTFLYSASRNEPLN